MLSIKELLDAPSYFVEITLLLSLSTWVVYRKLSSIESASTFTVAYLASIVLQLLVWLSCLGVMVYFDRSGANANAVYFLINCLIFIGLEVIFLYPRK